MKRTTLAAAAAVLAAFAGTTLAQNPSNGTQTGANTNSPLAGTGNAGDRTAQPGTKQSTTKHHHKKHKKSKAASAPQ